MSKHPSKPKIDEKDCLFINTWVRKPDEIADQLDLLKKKIVECNLAYIERLEQLTRVANEGGSSRSGEISDEQANLNKIIAALNFDVPDKARQL